MVKTVLITGASRGIGAAAARLFAENGWNVAVNYLKNAAAAQNLVSELNEGRPGCARAFECDVADFSAAERMSREAEETFGGVTCLVNNAGISLDALITDTSPEQWARVFAVNSTGVFNCTRAVLPGMIRRKSGSIVNIASMWGETGGSCEVAYSASKGAIIAFTKALAKEVGPSGIRVNCVSPGLIDTEMNSNLTPADISALCEETPLGRAGTPRDVAQAVLYLASEGAAFISGQVLGANGGFLI